MHLSLAPIALVSATFFACSNANPDPTGNGAETPISNSPGDIGGPGPRDAGTPAGGTPDAGPPCNTQALPLVTVLSIDGCVLLGKTTFTGATIVSAGCQDVIIIQSDGLDCRGAIGGHDNAFLGLCGTLSCFAPHLPGTITCVGPNATLCPIEICNDPEGADCP
jgi:hypothetical protein